METVFNEGFTVKEKISASIDVDLLNKIDKEMTKHQYSNRSKFIEYILRQVLYNKHEKLKLMEKSRERILSQFKALNEDILTLQEIISQEKKAEEVVIIEKEKSEKDAGWE